MTKPDEDAHLVERAKSGETAAFDELVVKHSPKLYGLVYHMTSNHEDTNDVLQDVFAKAYRSLKRFRGNSAFYTWIYSIAVNMTLNFLKRGTDSENSASMTWIQTSRTTRISSN
ncbi:MAG: sigma-70 family RNA polymerase sigma factor [Verrucomicrobiales bacterium]